VSEPYPPNWPDSHEPSAHFRDLDMVRRMATYGPGPETTPEQALDVIRIWAEKKLAKLESEETL
jgi:hypothetical protein